MNLYFTQKSSNTYKHHTVTENSKNKSNANIIRKKRLEAVWEKIKFH